MAWSEGLSSGQRSPDWLESLNVGTHPEKPWQWSDADVVFSAAYADDGQHQSVESPSEASSSSSSSSAGSTLSSPRESSLERLADSLGSVRSSATSEVASGSSTPSREAKQTTTALVVRSFHQGWDRTFELHHAWPRPAISSPSEVLIRNVAVGLNPVDFKSVVYKFGIAALPWVLGRDVAGVVEEIGSDVTHFKPGDRVWTCADSRHVRSGAYQAHCVAEEATVGKIPDNVSDEQAATLGTGLVTAAIALWWFFQLPMPSEAKSAAPRRGQDEWLLIYGGGAITGIFAAQLAAQAGLKVVAVASPDNFAHLRANGVTACVDRYGAPEDVLARVAWLTEGGGRLRYALDCVGSKTADLCQSALLASSTQQGPDGEREKAHFLGLAGNPKQPLPDGSNVVIHRISFSTTFYGDSSWSRRALAEMTSLLSSGKLVPARVQIVKDGLAGVRRGLEQLKGGRAPRAKKLVVRIGDTPAADVTNLGVRCELGWNGH